MKVFILILLIFALILPCLGCQREPAPVPMDISGKYLLNTVRNEAIINDAGQITKVVDGNARVYYQIFVGSFSDSNGDGIGDLRGIINRFDYLNDGDPNSGVSLGIEGIWLSPIFVSPSYHKYDTGDYYQVDPKFGTEEDLKELIDLCHQRNVQIILDLVINHTATSHPWFQKFVAAHKNYDSANEYYDFYSWTADPTAGATWSEIPGSNGHYYECNFSGSMPELNFNNDAVRQAMVDVAKYYLDLGVDGFRFDAAKYIYYGTTEENTNFWNWYMAQLRSIKPDIYTVAEVWDGDGVTLPYFSSTNCFNFTMSQDAGIISQTAKAGDVNYYVSYIENYLKNILAQRSDAMLCAFIANHDTDRAAGFLNVTSGNAFVAANLSILTPGSPFIYYGEEIGMKGSRGGANTDANRRLAMLWGDHDTIKDPTGANYSSAQSNGTVAEQLPNGDSLYNYYKKLIMIRKANPEIAYGSFQALKTECNAGGFISTYEGSHVAVLHNSTQSAVTLDISTLTDIPFATIAACIGLGTAKLEGTILTIEAQTSVVLR